MVLTATTPVLTDSKTLKEVVNSLTEHIPISTQGKCEQKNIFEILIRAATQRDSIENTTKILKNVPTNNNIRYHLEKYSALTTLEENLNTAIQSRLPDGIRQGQQKIAIDFNLIPYYGERQLIRGRRSYKTTYTLTSHKYGSVTFPIWIVCTYKKGKRRAHGRDFFIYAVYKAQLSLQLIHDDYRLRFGIESSYRLKNQCRIKTTIKKPIIRFLFVALSFLIVNIWIYLIWHYFSRLIKSSRQVFSHLFTLKQMLEFLRQAVDRNYGVACEIYLT